MNLFTPEEKETLNQVYSILCEQAEGEMYGFSSGGNPHEFKPDLECCRPEEIEAHRKACIAQDEGRYNPERHSYWEKQEDGTLVHYDCPKWGIGTQTWRDEVMMKLRDDFKKIFERKVCPICKNGEINPEDKFCKICGSEVKA